MTEKPNKGTNLELRIARMLFAEGMSPFVNVYFRSGLEPKSVTSPDVDVMGVRFFADCSVTYSHYDCKSNDAEVVSRILMLLGLQTRLPPGPVTYVRKSAPLDLKLYAMRHGVRLANANHIQEREIAFVTPLFGYFYPSISDPGVNELWHGIRNRHKLTELGGIIRYLDGVFWTELPFTRLRRTIAATTEVGHHLRSAGIRDQDEAIVLACAIRRLVYALMIATSQIAFLNKSDMESSVSEWLISEKLNRSEYQSIVTSTAQMTYDIYADRSRGQLQESDYHIPPPDYTESLVDLMRRMIGLFDALAYVMPVYDGLIFERAVQRRESVARALVRGVRAGQMTALRSWFRSLRLFLMDLNPEIGDWIGWEYIVNGSGLLPLNESDLRLISDTIDSISAKNLDANTPATASVSITSGLESQDPSLRTDSQVRNALADTASLQLQIPQDPESV